MHWNYHLLILDLSEPLRAPRYALSHYNNPNPLTGEQATTMMTTLTRSPSLQLRLSTSQLQGLANATLPICHLTSLVEALLEVIAVDVVDGVVDSLATRKVGVKYTPHGLIYLNN